MIKIFPTRTYALSFGFSEKHNNGISDVLKSDGASFVSSDSINEALEYIAAINNLLFVCVNSLTVAKIDQEKISSALEKKGIFLLSFKESDIENTKLMISSALKTFSPKGTEDTLLKSVQLIAPFFFKEAENNLINVPNVRKNFDYAVALDCVADAWFGKMTVFFDSKKIQENYPSLKDKNENELKDLFHEYTNQVSGIITQSLVNQGISAKGSLGLGIKLNPETAYSIVGFLPGIRFVDQKDTFCVQLSSKIMSEDPSFIKNFVLEFKPSNGEVEYLS